MTRTTGDEQRRTYVLDTCVLLADPTAPFQFEEHDVVLPLVVIEELDRKKTRMDEVGSNARRAIRLLEEQGASGADGMRVPVALPSGGSLRIELNGMGSPFMSMLGFHVESVLQFENVVISHLAVFMINFLRTLQAWALVTASWTCFSA